MPFFFKGFQKSFLEGEPYYALYRSGFGNEHGSKSACLSKLDNVALPIGTEIKIEKIYRMKRGFEPDAPFRSGDTAEYWTFSLKSAATWHDPKTGGAIPNKWAPTGHGVRRRSGEPFEERDSQAERRRRGIMTERRGDPREADRPPHVSESSYGPPSYARPAPPVPISAEDAMVEAVTWLHFGRTPENALPWLTYAAHNTVDQQDLDEIARYDAQVQRIVPEKWRAYHQRRLVIPMRYHPRSIGQTKPVRRH